MNIALDEWLAALASLKSDAVLGARLDEITADLGVDLDALPVPSSLDALLDNSGEWTLEGPARWLLGAMIHRARREDRGRPRAGRAAHRRR